MRPALRRLLVENLKDFWDRQFKVCRTYMTKVPVDLPQKESC
jgi:hypothetical protein